MYKKAKLHQIKVSSLWLDAGFKIALSPMSEKVGRFILRVYL